MLKIFTNKVLLAAPAMLLCAGFAQAQTTPVTPLVAAPTSVAVTYQKPSTAGAAVAVALTVHAGTNDFVVDPATVPFWLSLDTFSGTATVGGVTIHFQASGAAASLAAGTYNSSVHVRVSGFLDLTIPVALTVNDPASTLTVSQGVTQTVNWTYGTTKPTATLTMISSNQPIAFTVAAAVTSPAAPAGWLQVSSNSGIAYSFGTPVTVSFLPDVLDNSTVGAALTGTVTITPSVGSPINVAFTVNVLEPPSAITSIFPAQTPVHASGSLQVVITGSGFGTGGGYTTHPTTVSISYGAVALTDVTTIGGSISVPNPNTLLVTIPFQDTATTPNAILSAAGSIGISVTNGLTSEVAATSTLTVTTSPIIYSVTDAASLVEASAGTPPSFAPYELITLFGDNFGPTAGTPVIGVLDSFSRYPNTLTANTHALTISFYKQGTVGSGTHIADGYLLFATNNQINAMVPSGVTVAGITDLQIVVTYNALTSAVYAAKPAPARPGIFTTASSGQGQGAILLSNFTVNSSASTATKALKGGTVLIYVAGLGTPDSTSANTNSTAAAKFPTSCISPASYVTAEGLTSPATADGAVILASKLATNHFPPCFAGKTTTPTVTIGGQTAAVTYAGWVADSVTGLYQINAQVPTKAASGNAIPVVVTANGVSSQAGVTMAIQ
jgi:uncharacterized protein (TIGR03437 family)